MLEKLTEGYSIAETHRKWPTKTVKPNTIYKASLRDTEFAELLSQAYTVFTYTKLDELDRLSDGLASELYPDVQFREAEAALKRRIDTLKFTCGKIAPILSKRFNKPTQHVELSGSVDSKGIQVINYFSTATQSKAISKGITIDNSTLKQ